MKKLLAFTAILALSTVAMAQLDPDPDGMGIYFDMDATITCVENDPGMAPVEVYLLLTNPSGPTVGAWECDIPEDVEAYIAGIWVMANDGLNTGSGTEYQVGLGLVPFPVEGNVFLLASRSMLFLGLETDHAVFSLGGVAGSQSFPGGEPGYLVDLGILVPCQVPFGVLGGETAWVNMPGSCNIVANDDMTWGEVKSLY